MIKAIWSYYWGQVLILLKWNKHY